MHIHVFIYIFETKVLPSALLLLHVIVWYAYMLSYFIFFQVVITHHTDLTNLQLKWLLPSEWQFPSFPIASNFKQNFEPNILECVFQILLLQSINCVNSLQVVSLL